MTCHGCEAKDAEIGFMRELVKLFMEEKKNSQQVFIPTGVDESGKVFKMNEDYKLMTNIGAPVVTSGYLQEAQTEDIDVINEIMGH